MRRGKASSCVSPSEHRLGPDEGHERGRKIASAGTDERAQVHVSATPNRTPFHRSRRASGKPSKGSAGCAITARILFGCVSELHLISSTAKLPTRAFVAGFFAAVALGTAALLEPFLGLPTLSLKIALLLLAAACAYAWAWLLHPRRGAALCQGRHDPAGWTAQRRGWC